MILPLIVMNLSPQRVRLPRGEVLVANAGVIQSVQSFAKLGDGRAFLLRCARKRPEGFGGGFFPRAMLLLILDALICV